MVRFLCILLLSILLNVCYALAYDTLCAGGSKAFQSTFRTGVAVEVGPVMKGGLAARLCRATLSWDGQKLLIADGVAEIDLDLFGADLGTGEPVAAFQIKKSAAVCCVAYQIYSLIKPPHLIRTLHGGGYFRAGDTNLDGRVEIWADDSAAVSGLEGLHTGTMEFPPTLLLRFDHGRLLDFTSEFQPYFDQAIAEVRQQISPQEIQRFKQRAMAGPTRGASPPDDVSREGRMKTRILEVVWAYLYSGRQDAAWDALREMWPDGDLSRVATGITGARARGLRSQLDGVAGPASLAPPEHTRIYTYPQQPARPIMVRYYRSRSSTMLRRRVRVDLVVDCAGKVWSAEVAGKDKAVRESVKHATVNWKFIPAFVNGHPVASRLRMTISLAR